MPISQDRDAFMIDNLPKSSMTLTFGPLLSSDCAIISLATALRSGIQVVLASGRLVHERVRLDSVS